MAGPLAAYGYISDAGEFFAVQMIAAKASLMGFTVAPVNTPKRPQNLVTRKEVFVSGTGSRVMFPYPDATMVPWALGAAIVYEGVGYTAYETLDEIRTGVST